MARQNTATKEGLTNDMHQHSPEIRSIRGLIPALHPLQSQAMSEFFGTPSYWFLQDGGLLRFGPGVEPAASETFTVEADGIPMKMRLDVDPAQHSGLHWNDYQGRSRLLAWSLANERLLMRLSEALGASLIPIEQDIAVENGVWLAFALDDESYDDQPGARTLGSILFPAAWLGRLLSRASPMDEHDSKMMLDYWRNTPLPCSINFSGPAFTPTELTQVNPGDVVLVSNSRKLNVELQTSRRAWPLTASQRGWHISGDMRILPHANQENQHMNETDLNNETETPEISPEEAAIRALPVHLSFELAQLELSVNDLTSLQPGYVFALPAQVEGANVTIRANGRNVGRGEIVAIGETIGVRVLSWS